MVSISQKEILFVGHLISTDYSEAQGGDDPIMHDSPSGLLVQKIVPLLVLKTRG